MTFYWLTRVESEPVGSIVIFDDLWPIVKKGPDCWYPYLYKYDRTYTDKGVAIALEERETWVIM